MDVWFPECSRVPAGVSRREENLPDAGLAASPGSEASVQKEPSVSEAVCFRHVS